MESITYQEDGKQRTFLIKKPGAKILSDAKMESSKLFAKLVKSEDTVIFRDQLDDYMVKHGLITEETAKEIIEVAQKIDEKQKQLDAGGIKLSEARKVALDLRILRNKFMSLSAARNALDSNTIEGQVENFNFDYILINCILDENGERVFNDVYQYRDDSRQCVWDAANKLASMIYGISEDAEKDFPENKFLMKYGFVNDELDLVDKDGNYVDYEGNPIKDEEEVEFKPFLDDDGNEIQEDTEVEVEKVEEVEEVEKVVEESEEVEEKAEEQTTE